MHYITETFGDWNSYIQIAQRKGTLKLFLISRALGAVQVPVDVQVVLSSGSTSNSAEAVLFLCRRESGKSSSSPSPNSSVRFTYFHSIYAFNLIRICFASPEN
jgi:hypothetical protein